MSEPQPIGTRQAGGGDVRQAIARAAEKTGVDFQYLLAQAKLESSLDPSARAGTSSAAGLYQFTNGTWLQTLDRHGSAHGFDWAGSAIDRGRITDPQLRTQIMALRYDADASALMAAELARDNRAVLTTTLGRNPDAAELYLAHFLGSQGANRFLAALETNPEQSAAALMPKAAAANRPVFYGSGGAPRSVAEVMEWIRGKVSSAMEGGAAVSGAAIWAVADGPASAVPGSAGNSTSGFTSGGPIAREFHAARQSVPEASRQSMADTLRSTFAVADAPGGAAAPGFVREAYGQLRRFGL